LVAELLQGSAVLTAGLDAVAADRRAGTLIRGDFKWDKCLVLPSRRRTARSVKLVDWEFARLGRPEWDVGSAFANHLSWWVSSIAPDGDGAPDRLPRPAR
jgi:aminoglycoside phosphotransferase (APT) family kinase protein